LELPDEDSETLSDARQKAEDESVRLEPFGDLRTCARRRHDLEPLLVGIRAAAFFAHAVRRRNKKARHRRGRG
jgi:hypothetical protein